MGTVTAPVRVSQSSPICAASVAIFIQILLVAVLGQKKSPFGVNERGLIQAITLPYLPRHQSRRIWHPSLSGGCRDVTGPVPQSLLIRKHGYLVLTKPALDSPDLILDLRITQSHRLCQYFFIKIVL